MNIPARMYTSEVLALAKWKTPATLRARQARGDFPKHVDRSREFIYDGRQVYEALGLLPKDTAPKRDSIMEALDRL